MNKVTLHIIFGVLALIHIPLPALLDEVGIVQWPWNLLFLGYGLIFWLLKIYFDPLRDK